MLNFRPHTYDQLSRLPRAHFESELVEYVKTFFAREHEELGATASLEICQRILNNAESLGFQQQKSIFYFVSMTYMLGTRCFDDPQIEWLGAHLKNEFTQESTRISRAWSHCLDYIEKTAGDENQLLIAALIRAKHTALSDVPDSSKQDFNIQLLDFLQWLYPEKVAYQTKESLSDLIKHASLVAQHHLMDTGKGIGLLSSIMLFLGSFVHEDPLYPWLGKILCDNFATPESKIQNLFFATQNYIEIALRDDVQAGADDE
ncbi:MAG: hypothetical protein OEZ58_06485 [Gammaproteobacteria bacterium]|nr:hypothetical protein [Gammaproteobacteria bacterium]MDH5728618.1 hypothetical protein [Gammaproteobacteria bacterium]